MSGATVADMLADLIGSAESPWSGGTPANSANPAKNRTSIDAAGDSGVCEGLRKVANSQTSMTPTAPDSQKFAGLRRGGKRPQSEHPCGFSQDSQNSQGVAGTNEPGQARTAHEPAATLPLDAVADRARQARSRPYKLAPAEADAAHAEPWNDAACARFVARVALFLRRGIHATDADDLAERLHLRDVHGDDRVTCVECVHLVGRAGAWRCANARAAGVGAELPRVLTTTMQRCMGFAA